MSRTRLSRVLTTALASVPALAIVLATAPHAAFADDDSYGPDANAPDPGVARVSVIEGSVDVKRGDSGDTVAASINAPLAAGDYISTEDQSHAEIEFDYATELRLAPDTQLRFTQLQPQAHELQLGAGTIDVRLFHGTNAHATIETPQATITPRKNGSYVVNVDGDGNTQVTVRSGLVDVETAAGTQALERGGTLAITGDQDHPQFQTVEAVAYGGFDTWIAGRDRYLEAAESNPYAENGMVGTEDLYANGRWVDNAQYGQVWVPNVGPDWAPYHDGRWVWEPYYGWTWVDNEPWGWAPFHYGNWFYADSGWAWYPGVRPAAQPYVYRPALVAFFNFGGGEGGVSLDFGNVGWVPLAPNEPFHPWWGNGGGNAYAYGYGRGGYNNTTIINNYTRNVTITNVYVNAKAPGGVAGVANGSFANGNFATIRTLEPIELRRAEPIRGVIPIVPTQNNLAFREHESGIRPLAPVARFQTFRDAPARVAQPTFAQQREKIENAAVRSFPRHADEITRNAPPAGGYAPNRAASPGYEAPDRGAEPQRDPGAQRDTNAPHNADAPRNADPAYAKPANTNGSTTGGPFDRFNHTSTPQDGRAPSYATPGDRTTTNGAANRTTTGTRTPIYRKYRSANKNAPHPAATQAPEKRAEPQ